MIKILWVVYLTILIWLTYDLISATVSRINRKVLDTDITHLTIVSIMWSVWYFYFLN